MKMMNRIRISNFVFLWIILALNFNNYSNYIYANESLDINEINIKEYNMSILSVNQNDQV